MVSLKTFSSLVLEGTATPPGTTAGASGKNFSASLRIRASIFFSSMSATTVKAILSGLNFSPTKRCSSSEVMPLTDSGVPRIGIDRACPLKSISSKRS